MAFDPEQYYVVTPATYRHLDVLDDFANVERYTNPDAQPYIVTLAELAAANIAMRGLLSSVKKGVVIPCPGYGNLRLIPGTVELTSTYAPIGHATVQITEFYHARSDESIEANTLINIPSNPIAVPPFSEITIPKPAIILNGSNNPHSTLENYAIARRLVLTTNQRLDADTIEHAFDHNDFTQETFCLSRTGGLYVPENVRYLAMASSVAENLASCIKMLLEPLQNPSQRTP